MGKHKHYRVTYFGFHHKGGTDNYRTPGEAQKRYNELMSSGKWNYVTSYMNDGNGHWKVLATHTEGSFAQ